MVLLIIAMGEALSGTLSLVALVLLLASALGGFLLFLTHLRKRPLQTFVIFGHGISSTVAFVLVLIRLIQVA